MKLSRTLIILSILLLSFTSIRAQEKYEYGQVFYGTASRGALATYKVTVSTTTYQSMNEGTIEDGNILTNFVPVNKVLNDLADKGWEVYSTTAGVSSGINYYYYIRKKKQ